MQQAQPFLTSQLPTKYGPAALIGRALIEMEEALRLRGITLSKVPIETLLTINKVEADDWLPLIPIFDPTFNDLDDSNIMCFVGRNSDGRVVATQAARLFHWQDTNFKAEAETLRLLYQRPDRDRLQNEHCTVTALAAQVLTGRFVFSGAAWNAPETRRRGVVQLMPRIARAYALTTWNADMIGSMMARHLVQRGVHTRVGYGNLEWGVELRNSRMGDVDFSLQWMQADALIDDLRRVRRAIERERQLGELKITHDDDN